MKAIVACDNNWGIGKDGDLLFHLPGDLAYFREQTSGMIIIVGRKTLESFPGGKPLPNRTNVVLTRNENYTNGDAVVCNTTADLLEKIAELQKTINKADDIGKNTGDVFVCGGGEIYKTLLPQCDEVLVTKIDTQGQADTFFPDLDADEDFELAWEGEPCEEQGLTYRFTRYKRK